MRKSLAARLAHLFLFIMILASVGSFIVMTLVFNGSFINEMRAGQNAVAVAMLELDQKTDFNLDEILKIAANPLYTVTRENGTPAGLAVESRKELELNRIAYVKGRFFPIGKTFVLIDGSIIKISNHPQNNVVGSSLLKIFLTLALSIIIGTGIMLPIGKRALRPVFMLSRATKEVARGNFDVRVETETEGELGELARSFNKMADELKNMEIFRRDFISDVSHEFKTPIASIQGYAKLLQESGLKEEDRKEYTDIIMQEADRMSKLSANILKLSKLENQEIILDQTEFSLDEQIRRTLLILESKWEEKNINLNVELEEIRFYGNEELLQQVWLNLLDNAVKFSDYGGEISVKLFDAGSKVKVKITDHGIGMTEETRKRIFEKFYQADKARSSEGTGLGLSLVKRIVDLCGGSITVKSRPGEGSTFTVELPVQERQDL